MVAGIDFFSLFVLILMFILLLFDSAIFFSFFFVLCNIDYLLVACCWNGRHNKPEHAR